MLRLGERAGEVVSRPTSMLEEKNTRKGFFEEEQFRFRDGSRCERGKFGATRGGRGIEAETQRLGSARQDGK